MFSLKGIYGTSLDSAGSLLAFEFFYAFLTSRQWASLHIKKSPRDKEPVHHEALQASKGWGHLPQPLLLGTGMVSTARLGVSNKLFNSTTHIATISSTALHTCEPNGGIPTLRIMLDDVERVW